LKNKKWIYWRTNFIWRFTVKKFMEN